MFSRAAGYFFLGAIVGSIASATTVLLSTPLSGEELRKKILDGIHIKSSKKQKKKQPRASKKKIEDPLENGEIFQV